MDGQWRIDLLGELRAVQGERVITRWPTQKTGFLLAYLALHQERSHRREALVELFWPESDPRAGRQSLSQSLYVVRRHLEPPGHATGAILLADRASVRLNPEAVTTDVSAFEAAVRAAARTTQPEERTGTLVEAAEIYRGELLTGCHEAWALPPREWLAESFSQTLSQLVLLLEQAGDLPRALAYARRAVSVDPLREEAQRDVIRLLDAVGQPAAALRQYRDLERLLCQELDAVPAAATQALIREIQRRSTSLAPIERAACRVPRAVPDNGVTACHNQARHTAPGTWHAVTPTLPQRLTQFFGRQVELTRLREMLLSQGARLVTLTGPGGSGKTRLALEAAARLKDAWRGEVRFVPLMDLSDPRLILEAMRDALSLPRPPEADPWEQVVEALSHRPALLVLDNFEHLVTQGAMVVRLLLERVPMLTCLVTSRQRLGLAGEREFPVPPLPTPGVPVFRSAGVRVEPVCTAEDLNIRTPAELLQCESVALFVDRAQTVRPEFQLTLTNAGDVAVLCRRLEGIPLALELAAARAQVLTPAQMVVQLERRFDFLVSRDRDAEPRHRTLRTALAWSYQFLSEDVKRFFTRLSVFRGGWSLAAAAQVAALPSADSQPLTDGDRMSSVVGGQAVLEYLQQLRECSMVLAEESGREVRFRMLEMLREYAAEQLVPAEQAALQRRHAGYYLSMAEAAGPELRGPDQGIWLDRLEQDLDNLRAALHWAVAHDEAEAGLRLGGALWEFWEVRGHVAEGRERLAELLAMSEASGQNVARARTLLGAGALANDQGDFAGARAFLEESLAIGWELNDAPGIALAHHHLGDVELYEGDWEAARAHYEASVAHWRRAGHRRELAMSLESLGTLAFKEGHLATAQALYEESLAIRQELHDRLETAHSLGKVGNIALCRGDYRTARARYEESLTIFREMKSREGVSDLLQNLGAVAHAEGNLPTARALFQETLVIRQELGIRRCLALTLNHLSEVACEQGDEDVARTLCEQSLAIGHALRYREGIARSLSIRGSLALRQGDWKAARTSYRESLVIRRELGDRLGVAGSLEGLAATERAQGDPEQAVRMLGVAAALREAIGSPLPPGARPAYDEQVAALRAALGEAAYSAAWGAGRALTWERAAAEALGEPDLDPFDEDDVPLSLFSGFVESRAP